MVHICRGLREARIVKPGYAIEYDRILPNQIKPSLEVVGVDGLFSAGQINGTSGYEEAAAQGLMDGINAVLSLGRKGLPWCWSEPGLHRSPNRRYWGQRH